MQSDAEREAKNCMRSLPLSICLLLVSSLAHAQYMREYGFVGPLRATSSNGSSTATFGILPPTTPPAATSGSTNDYMVGGGVERLLDVHEHAGVGLDLAGIVPGTGKVGEKTIGSVSVNGTYHFLFGSKWDPFVTGGYSLLFRDFTANGFNAGGGLHYWFGGAGLTFECRELIAQTAQNLLSNHFLEFRFGVGFRQRR